MQQLIEDELATSVLDYGRSDYLAEFYLLQEDYENGVYDYYIIRSVTKNVNKFGFTH